MSEQDSTTAALPGGQPLLARLQQSPFVAALFAGAISGLLVISFDISLAALIFSSELSGGLPRGIGIFLIGSVIVGVIVSLGSSFKPVIAAPQDQTAVILASAAAAIAASLKISDSTIDPFPTVVALIAVTSIVTGAFFLLLGVLRLGVLGRFIPYPVVGGFLAGAGWLLLLGSVSVMARTTIDLYNLSSLLEPDMVSKCGPGLLFGMLLTALLRRYKNFLVLPGLLVGSVGIFYAGLYLSGSSMQAAADAGWLLGPFPDGGIWPPLERSDIASIQWHVLFSNAGNIAAVAIMATITILLSASSVELATEQEIDLDRELRATGLGNIVGGLAGGMVSYLTLFESAMNYNAGAKTRLAGIISALCCVVVLIFGAGSLSYLPLPVFGGLLSYLGFLVLIDTVYEGWFRLRHAEYGVIIIILLAIAVLGFLPGIAVGLVVSFALFAASYSRIDVIRNAISGANLRSNVGRSEGEEMTLIERGYQLYVLQLQGYIFFGTAYTLLARAQQRIVATDLDPVRYLLLDFRHVNGLDSSAVASFLRLRKLANSHRVKLIFTEVPPVIRNHMLRGGVVVEDDDVCRFFPDLDHGIEDCENNLIREAPPSKLAPPMLFYDLEEVFNGRQEMVRFLGYLDRVELPADQDLFRRGDKSDDLFLIESGKLTAWLEIDSKTKKRLRTMGPGSVVGESGLYLSEMRSATVTANEPSTLYRLSQEALQRLMREAPELAAAFHEFVVRLLAKRIVNTTGPVKALFN